MVVVCLAAGKICTLSTSSKWQVKAHLMQHNTAQIQDARLCKQATTIGTVRLQCIQTQLTCDKGVSFFILISPYIIPKSSGQIQCLNCCSLMFLDFGCEYRQLLVAFAGQSEMLMTQELYDTCGICCLTPMTPVGSI